jgi:hypothetical protein
LAWRRAEERFADSGAPRWVREGYLPRPEESTRREIARQLHYVFFTTEFALGWTRTLGRISPDFRARLLELTKAQSKLNWVIGWLDIGVGARTLGISGYFEDQAFAIRSDWSKIEAELA